MLRILWALCFLVAILPTHAQTPTISNDCENNFVAYLDSYNAKQYKEASKYLQRVISECPAMRESMYINGAKIYRARLDDQAETTSKVHLLDTLLQLHDRRIQHFGDRYLVLQYKANDLVRYALAKQHAEAQALFELVMDSAVNEISSNSLNNYLKVSQYQFKNRHLEKSELAQRLHRVLRIVDNRRNAGAKQGDASVENNVMRFCTSTLACDELKIVLSPFVDLSLIHI